MKRISYLFSAIILITVVFGQTQIDRSSDKIGHGVVLISSPSSQMEKDRRDERMEMMMTWKLTNDLDLTPEQADKFFPRFREHRENMNKLEEETIIMSNSIKEKIEHNKEISQKELENILSEIKDLELKKIAERERFIEEASEYLNTNQLAQLALYKHYFIDDLRKEIRRKPLSGA